MRENDRLTNQRNNGIKTGYWSMAKKEELVQRLAEYEDTELTPTEIYGLKAETILSQIKNLWISASDRLPCTDEFVLVTVSGIYNNTTFSDAIQIGAYDEREEEWFIEGYPEREDANVVAWMPLPVPYRKKGEVNNDNH